MPITYLPIASQVLGTATNTVTFDNIPQTFTDIVLRMTVRNSATSYVLGAVYRVNGSTSSIYSGVVLSFQNTTGTVAVSNNTSNIQTMFSAAALATANTFSSLELYLPSYTNSSNKIKNLFSAAPNNSTSGGFWGIRDSSGLFANTGAVTSLTIAAPSGNFVVGSSFYLYGIKNN